MLGFLLLAMTGVSGLMTGPANCRFAAPADLPQGRPEWIGPCVAGKADGLGVVRVSIGDGGAEIFYGRVKAGIPIEGMIGDSGSTGWRIVTGFDASLHQDEKLATELQQDPRYWKEAASAARVAAKHYWAQGNGASARFYAGQAKMLDKGPGE